MRAHLAERGIKPERVYFGGTLPEPEHLTRYSLCDLFLDSFPYCGHATASNALFGGVPLLTLPGRTFASRVSASLLTALGMTELIAASPEDYVRKAVTLAKDPAKLSTLKAQLIAARRTSPLFDGRRFAADIEKAYRIMLERHARGEAPAAINL
jgi:predicted O-linked N-acetylglucosamine transferase (SPINDLY family)